MIFQYFKRMKLHKASQALLEKMGVLDLEKRIPCQFNPNQSFFDSIDLALKMDGNQYDVAVCHLMNIMEFCQVCKQGTKEELIFMSFLIDDILEKDLCHNTTILKINRRMQRNIFGKILPTGDY